MHLLPSASAATASSLQQCSAHSSSPLRPCPAGLLQLGAVMSLADVCCSPCDPHCGLAMCGCLHATCVCPPCKGHFSIRSLSAAGERRRETEERGGAGRALGSAVGRTSAGRVVGAGSAQGTMQCREGGGVRIRGRGRGGQGLGSNFSLQLGQCFQARASMGGRACVMPGGACKAPARRRSRRSQQHGRRRPRSRCCSGRAAWWGSG